VSEEDDSDDPGIWLETEIHGAVEGQRDPANPCVRFKYRRMGELRRARIDMCDGDGHTMCSKCHWVDSSWRYLKIAADLKEGLSYIQQESYLHTIYSQRPLHDPIIDDMKHIRKMEKVRNFGINYGMGKSKMADENLHVDVQKEAFLKFYQSGVAKMEEHYMSQTIEAIVDKFPDNPHANDPTQHQALEHFKKKALATQVGWFAATDNASFPQPTDVTNAQYGEVIAVQLPVKEKTIWGFQSAGYRDQFAADFGAEVLDFLIR